jgi:signal transduction histidine kinase
LPDKVTTVTADLDLMIQVMLNLLSNAVKFCDSTNGRVEIALAERDGSLRIDVRDNGRGISPEDHEAIFSKFHQVGDTLTDKPHGSGLGLHISRQIVEHFGGRMWVEQSWRWRAFFRLRCDRTRTSRPGSTPERAARRRR